MGRPRKHAALKLLDGTIQHHRDDLGADMLPGVGLCVPTRPLNAKGSEFFLSVVRAYPERTLGESDAESLTVCAEWVQTLHHIANQVKAGKLSLLDAIKPRSEATRQYASLASRFGLTPSDRGKVKLAAPPESGSKEAKYFG